MKVDSIEIAIESDAKKAIAELDRMIGKLNQVGTVMRSTGKMGGVSSGVKSATNSLKSYTSTASKATKSTFSLASAFGRFYASCFLVIRGVKAIGNAIGSSMDYIETYNYFNVITDKIGTEFGDAWKENGYSSAEEYANSFRDRLTDLTTKMTGFKIGAEGGLYSTDSIGLGLDPEKIMSYQANIASITNAVGLTGETATNTAKAMSMLAADMSSLKNVDLETVMTNLQSGLIGQSRALYKYGIDITNTTLGEYALANGISKKVSEMTQAEKMQLRMIAILDQSKVAYGDMANTIGGVANQYRIFKQQISNLARTIGALFIPVLQAVLPYINGFIIALQRLFTWIGSLLGVKWSKLMDGISKGYTDTGLDALGEDADDVTDSLTDADKAANKLKKTVHGYDELHIATDNSGSDKKIGGTGGIDLSSGIADALADYEKIWDDALAKMQNKAQAVADSIASFFKKIWVAIEPFRTAMKTLWDEGLSKLSNFSFQALKDFYNEFLVPIGKWAFGTEDKGFTRLVNIINEDLNNIEWETINKNLKDFWIAIEPYAEAFGEGLIDFFEFLGDYSVTAINNIFGTDGAFTRLTKALEDGDPDSAKKWGTALGALVIGIAAFNSVRSIAVKINELTNLLTVLNNLKLLAPLGTFALALTVAVIGFNLGKDLGIWIDENFGDGDTKDYYVNFHFTGDDGFFDTISEDWGTTLDAMGEMSSDKDNPIIAGLTSGLLGPFIMLALTIVKNWDETIATIKKKWSDFSADYNLAISAIKVYFVVLWESVKQTFNDKWGEIVEWWKSSGISKWFETYVKPWLSREKWVELFQLVKAAFVAGWKLVVDWWNSSALVKWYNNDVKPWFSAEKWSFSSIKEGLTKAFNNAISAIKEAWNKLASWLNERLTINIDTSTVLGKAFSTFMGGATSIKLGKLPTFSTGGFPEDGLFMANHGEMVGNFSNGKTAVANNEQITDGIKNAVIEGMMQVMMSNNQNDRQTSQPIQLMMDGRVVAETTLDNFKTMARQGLMPSIA